jgi:hypothetical protein
VGFDELAGSSIKGENHLPIRPPLIPWQNVATEGHDPDLSVAERPDSLVCSDGPALN